MARSIRTSIVVVFPVPAPASTEVQAARLSMTASWLPWARGLRRTREVGEIRSLEIVLSRASPRIEGPFFTAVPR